MKTPAIALILALSAVANAQTPVPPKPKVLATPAPKAKAKPRSKPKPAPAPADDPANLTELPAAAPSAPKPARSASTATTLTGYRPKVKATLAKDWSTALTPRSTDFTPGNLSLVFTLDAKGAVTEVKITDNSSNEAFAKFCDTYVRGIQFDAPPARSLQNGTLEIPFTFSLY